MGACMEDLREDLMSVHPSHWGYPHPISFNFKGGSEGGPTTHQPDGYLLPQSSCMQTRQLLPSMNPRLFAVFMKSAELCNIKG